MGKLQKGKTRNSIKNSQLKENTRNNSNSVGCNNRTKLLVPRNGRKKLNIYN